MSIIEDFVDSGAVSGSDLLYALHKTGRVNVPKFIKEAVANIKLDIENETDIEAVKKMRETAIYLTTMADIIEDITDDEDEYVETESTQVINVVGGAV